MPVHDNIFSILPVLFESGYWLFWLLVIVIAVLATWGQSLPNRKTIFLMAAPMPLYLLGIYVPLIIPLCQIYTFILIAALIIDRFLLSVSPSQLEIRRNFQDKLCIGEENEVLLTLVNNSSQTLITEIEEDIPDALCAQPFFFRVCMPLDPFETKMTSYRLVAGHRGLFRFGYTFVRYGSRLRLLWITKQGSRPETVRVFPNLQEIRRLRARYSKSLSAGELRKQALGQEGTQFSSLRNYYTGDDLRRMDWNASARMDNPIVRTYTPEVDQPVLILLDAGWKMQLPVDGLEKFDWALNAGLSLANVALDRGDHAAFGVFSNEITLKTGFGQGRKHRQLLLERLYDIHAESVAPDYGKALYHFSRLLKKRCLVVLFTDLVDKIVSQALLQGLSAFSTHHLILVVTFQDRELDTLRDTIPKTIMEAYQRGVAEDVTATRQEALAELTRDRHIISMDVPPQAMSSALIHQYLTLKRKNLI